jgi:radical SAM superfamily enzyme YgiQ (UPF0313 family)
MRVVLLSPYSGIEATGLRILSACLKRAGFDTRMIFLPDLSEAMAAVNYDQRAIPAAAVQRIAELCSDASLVAMTVMTPSFDLARGLTAEIRRHVAAPILWGGVHPTVCPQECLDHADIVCIGEGERTIVELAERLAQGRGFAEVRNLAWRKAQGDIQCNSLHPLQKELDELPFPDYDYTEHHVLHEGAVVQCTQSLMHYYLTDLGSWTAGPVYGVITTRGCPYRCTYCANNAYAALYPHWTHIRRRSVLNVIAEICAVRERLPRIEAIILRDDTFLANPLDYIADFCTEYRRQVNLPFRAYTTAQTADPKKLQLLTEAGLCYVIMGIQSGARQTQAVYQRHVTNERMLRAAQTLHSLRPAIPRPTYDVITDNPYETREDGLQTLQLVNQLPAPYRLALYSLTFYPGTELARQAQADGTMEEDDRSAYSKHFQRYAPNYHNFALFCHSLNLPRPFLYLLSRRPVYQWLSRGWADRASGWMLERLLALRLRRNRRLYARRRAVWLDSPGQSYRHFKV